MSELMSLHPHERINVATSKLANVATWRYGATLATWQYGATLATCQMHTHAHFCSTTHHGKSGLEHLYTLSI